MLADSDADGSSDSRGACAYDSDALLMLTQALVLADSEARDSC